VDFGFRAPDAGNFDFTGMRDGVVEVRGGDLRDPGEASFLDTAAIVAALCGPLDVATLDTGTGMRDTEDEVRFWVGGVATLDTGTGIRDTEDEVRFWVGGVATLDTGTGTEDEVRFWVGGVATLVTGAGALGLDLVVAGPVVETRGVTTLGALTTLSSRATRDRRVFWVGAAWRPEMKRKEREMADKALLRRMMIICEMKN